MSIRDLEKAYRSQFTPEKDKFGFDDLINLITPSGTTTSATSSKKTNALNELNALVDSSTNEQSLNLSSNYVQGLAATTNNVSDIVLLSGTQNKINNKKQDLSNYQSSLDVAAGMANKFIDYRVQDYKDMTLEDVMMELRNITDFNSYVYEGPDKSKFKNYVGYSNSGGMNDKQVINRINEYERTLNTMVEAFQNDGVITDNEIFFILTGDLKGFEQAKIDNIKRIENNLTGKIKSINAIKNHQKKLLDAVTRSGKKTSDAAVEFIVSESGEIVEAEEELKKSVVNDAVQTPGSLFHELTFDEAVARLNELTRDMSYQEVLQLYATEISNIESAIEVENSEYKLWSGTDFTTGIDAPAKEEIARTKIGQALESYTSRLSPREQKIQDEIDKESRQKEFSKELEESGVLEERFDADVVETKSEPNSLDELLGRLDREAGEKAAQDIVDKAQMEIIESLKPDRTSVEIENDPETFDENIKVEESKMTDLGDATFKDVESVQGINKAVQRVIPEKSPVKKLFKEDGSKLSPSDLANMSVTQLRKTLRKAQGDVKVKGFKTPEQAQLIKKIIKDAAFIQKYKNNKDAIKEIEFVVKRMHQLYEQLTDDFLKNIKL